MFQHLNIRDPKTEDYEPRVIFSGGVFTAMSQMQALPSAKFNPFLPLMKRIVMPIAKELNAEAKYREFSPEGLVSYCKYQYCQYLESRIEHLKKEVPDYSKSGVALGIESKIRRYSKLSGFLLASPEIRYEKAQEKFQEATKTLLKTENEKLKMY